MVGIVDPDGRNRVDISGRMGGYSYCPQVSPDERQMVFHRDYLLHIADVDGGIPRNVRRLDTGNPFDFVVHWSPTGEWILLVCGPFFKRSDPWLIRPDGSDIRLGSNGMQPRDCRINALTQTFGWHTQIKFCGQSSCHEIVFALQLTRHRGAV